MDIDDKQNLAFESLPESQPPINDVDEQDKQIAPPDTHATIDDKETSPPNSHPPNDVSNEHEKQIPPFTMENKQTSPHESPSPIQQNLSSEKNKSQAPEQTFQTSSDFYDNKEYPDVTAGPVFNLGHDDASYILDNTCTREMIEFHNSNWPIVTHFYNTVGEDQDTVPCVHLL